MPVETGCGCSEPPSSLHSVCVPLYWAPCQSYLPCVLRWLWNNRPLSVWLWCSVTGAPHGLRQSGRLLHILGSLQAVFVFHWQADGIPQSPWYVCVHRQQSNDVGYDRTHCLESEWQSLWYLSQDQEDNSCPLIGVSVLADDACRYTGKVRRLAGGDKSLVALPVLPVIFGAVHAGMKQYHVSVPGLHNLQHVLKIGLLWYVRISKTWPLHFQSLVNQAQQKRSNFCTCNRPYLPDWPGWSHTYWTCT